eukprot:COSAG06_NODE_50443_length_318_cov_1.392694_1_plen_32_part_10
MWSRIAAPTSAAASAASAWEAGGEDAIEETFE